MLDDDLEFVDLSEIEGMESYEQKAEWNSLMHDVRNSLVQENANVRYITPQTNPTVTEITNDVKVPEPKVVVNNQPMPAPEVKVRVQKPDPIVVPPAQVDVHLPPPERDFKIVAVRNEQGLLTEFRKVYLD